MSIFFLFLLDSFSVAEPPAKRTILKKDFEYLNSTRSRFQEYLQVDIRLTIFSIPFCYQILTFTHEFTFSFFMLQRLVRSPILRTSGLLHSFLTPGQEMEKLFEPDSVGREAHRKVNSLKSKLVIEVATNVL